MERRIISAILLCSVVLSFSNLISQPFWFQEYIAPIWVPLLFVHIISLPAFVFRFTRSSRVLLGVCLVLVSYAIARYSSALYMFEFSQKHAFNTEQSISVFYLNKYLYNDDVTGTVSAVDANSPDIVLLLEIDSNWIERSDLRSKYPFRHEILDRGVWNMALYSRFPLSDVRDNLGEDVPPVIIAHIKVSPSRALPLAFVHMPPPASADSWTQSRYIARRLSTELRHSREPWIVVGDINSGPFGRVYESFLNAARVRNASEGFGLFATWNAKLPTVRASLDHIFIKDSVVVKEFSKIHVAGSDHWGLFMKYGVRPN